jgi:hydroxyethylthiazole kinase-like uncharacterized protein yjeF
MKTLTAAQMREADRRSIEDIGIPGTVLMNAAGAAVFQEVDRGPVGIVCGKGNNGGDGFVVARLAIMAGHDTRVVLLDEPDSIQGDARIFLDVYRNLGGELRTATSNDKVVEALSGLHDCAMLVDAVLGTGIEGEVRGIPRAAIDNWPEVYTVAVDLPSGLNADTGEPCGACIRADVTVTFQYAKTGFENPDAIDNYLGRVVVADIGIPEICADDEAWAALQAFRLAVSAP